jgi:hypothetical protein
MTYRHVTTYLGAPGALIKARVDRGRFWHRVTLLNGTTVMHRFYRPTCEGAKRLAVRVLGAR